MAATVNEFLKWFNSLDVQSLWEATPHKPQMLGAMNLFPAAKPVVGTFHRARLVNDRIRLLPTAQRGAPGTTQQAVKHRTAALEIPHIPALISVNPEDLANMDGGDSYNAKASMSMYLKNEMERLRVDIEATEEWHRLGALRGELLDADSAYSVLHNYFDLFDVAQPTHLIDSNATLASIDALRKKVIDALGADSASGVAVLCGDALFTALESDEVVVNAKTTELDKTFLAEGHLYNAFTIRQVTFIQARHNLGGAWVNTNKGHAIVSGCSAYEVYDGSPNTVTGVNKPGRYITATPEKLPHESGIEVKLQLNRLYLNSRPSLCIEVTYA